MQRLDDPLDVGQLARHAGMPGRTFTRRFAAETGVTPMRWLVAQRVLEARRLLETSDLSITLIAQRCGLGSATNPRSHLLVRCARLRRRIDTAIAAHLAPDASHIRHATPHRRIDRPALEVPGRGGTPQSGS